MAVWRRTVNPFPLGKQVGSNPTSLTIKRTNKVSKCESKDNIFAKYFGA